MNDVVLLSIVDQHLDLIRSTPRATDEDIRRNRLQFEHRKKVLGSFIAFWSAKECPWPIPSAVVMDWISENVQPGHPYRTRYYLSAIRSFLTYLRVIEPRTEVHIDPFRMPPRRRRNLLSEQEIANLTKAASKLRTGSKFRHLIVETLFGLLASTGLRIGEALRLAEDDMKLDQNPPYLTIRDTKFGKSRMVVLHPTTAVHLRHFQAQRATALNGLPAQTLFTTRLGKPLSYDCVRRVFLRLVHHANIQRESGKRNLTIHSLRHSFAVRRLTLWHQAGQNVAELLPHLSVYMGHSRPADTYWYLSATAELLEAASERFESYKKEPARR
ncbi:MAG: tyrosine-type recombinase/integrase [Bryobacteraceae bacterium]